MKEKILGLLGLMRRAGAIAVGEEKTGESARTDKARLLLLSADASDNARKRIEGFAAAGKVPWVALPFTKAEFAAAVGLVGGSMAAIEDAGFAGALLKALSQWEPERYSAQAKEIMDGLRGRTQGNKRKRNGLRRTNG